jgi:hypothetical protein
LLEQADQPVRRVENRLALGDQGLPERVVDENERAFPNRMRAGFAAETRQAGQQRRPLALQFAVSASETDLRRT